jgi:hypothetical protein
LRSDISHKYFCLRHNDESSVVCENHIGRYCPEEELPKQRALIVPYLSPDHASGSERKSNKQCRRQTNLHAISTSRIHIAFKIDLEAIRDACIDIGEYSAVFEGMCASIDVESISVHVQNSSSRRSGIQGIHEAAYIVAGSV